MADRHWVKITAWHVLDATGREADWEPGLIAGAEYETRCGRTVKMGAPIRSTLGAESSCEVCLRIVAREDDRGGYLA